MADNKGKQEEGTQATDEEEYARDFAEFAGGSDSSDSGVDRGDDAGTGSQGEQGGTEARSDGDGGDGGTGAGEARGAGSGDGGTPPSGEEGKGDEGDAASGTAGDEGGDAQGRQGEQGDQGSDQRGGGEAGGDGGRPAPEDWKASLTEDQRRHVQRLEHENLSNRGRVSALTRRQREMETELSRAQARGADPLAINPENFPEEWRKFKEDNPDAAKAIEGVFGSELSRIAKGLQERIERVENRSGEDYATEQQTILLDLHPDAREIVNSEAFSEWLQRQPDPVQGLMQGNAYEGATLLDYWKAAPEYKPVQPPKQEEQGGSKGESSGSSPPSNDAGSAQERNRERLAEAAGGSKPTRGPRATTSVPDDFEDAFNHYARQQEREAS